MLKKVESQRRRHTVRPVNCQEAGDSLFMYFVDTGFWSKYGQWGSREYYDAATATSPAAAAALFSEEGMPYRRVLES